MATTQKKKTGKSAGRLLSSRFSTMRALVALSLMFNVALLGLLLASGWTNAFDDQIIRRGDALACSRDFHQEVSKKDQGVAANVEYRCIGEDAKPYYLDGLNKYRASKGLEPVQE